MKKLLLTVLVLSSTASAALERGGKTYYAMRQYDSGTGREQSLWHTHTTTDIGNKHGVSLQVLPFASWAVDTHEIAKQLTINKSRQISITSDRFGSTSETTLPYQAIKHNTEATPVEEEANLTLHPSLTVAGATLGFFQDGSHLHPGLALNISVPIFYINASMSQAGGTKTMADYFSGAYQQITPSQEALKFGRLGSRSSVAFGPLSSRISWNAIETERSYIGLSVGGSLGSLSTPNQTYLFDAHAADFDHHKISFGCEAGTTMWNNARTRGELMVSATYSYLFGGKEKRLLGVMDDDGSRSAYSSYLLGAEKNKSGVMPLANVLHRDVTRTSNHQLETNLMAAITWKEFTLNTGYGFFCRREEQLNVSDWPENTYAVAYPTYDTATQFANNSTLETVGETDILLNHRFITADMLDTSIAHSPAQVSTTIFANLGYNGNFKKWPYALGAGLSYELALARGCPSMMTLWAKFNLSF